MILKKITVVALLMLGIGVSAWSQTGTWSGKIEIQGVQLPLVFHLNEENPTMDSPDQGARGIPIKVEKTDTGIIKISIPSIGGTYEGQWLVKQIVGTFKQWGNSFPLTLKPGEERLNRPQTPKGPFPYSTEEVSFTHGDAVLKGTLTLPKGYSVHTPVLIMITGSGLQNRDEELFEHKPFAVIADAFARAGIATLRYDDRGFGESTGDIVNCTTKDLKNDALAGIGLLRKRFDTVGVIGHSEGGTIALMLAAEGKVDFAVSLAGMVVSGAEVLLWQNRLALTAAGVTQEDVNAYCKLLEEAFEAVVGGKPVPSAQKTELPEPLKQIFQAVTAQLQTPYLRYFVALDIRPLLGQIECPVLALNGTKDMQVDCKSNLGALNNGLPDNAQNSIQAVEGVNHLFQHCTTGASTEYKTIEETFAPQVLEEMIRWMISTFNKL